MSEPKDKVLEYSGGHPGTEYEEGEVICPWCGTKYGDCWEWVKEAPDEMECEECGNRFTFWAEYLAHYWSEPIKGTPSGTETDLSEPEHG